MEALAKDSAQDQELSLWARRSLLAVQKGVESAAIRHKQAGVPMVVSDENGEMRHIPADEIVVDYDILNAPYPEV